MNRILHALAFLAVVSFTACKSATSFDTPNELRNITGTLHLTNGKSYRGKLIINTNAAFSSPVRLIPDGEKESMKFDLGEVDYYETRGETYVLKNVRGALNIGRNFSFMKRLTKADSRIQMFEDLQVSTSTDRNGSTSKRYETQYYLQLPGEETANVWALNSNKFVPNFDEKMSKLLADCPSVSNKIANKESGYYYAQVSLFKEKRAEVLWNIIDEYNKCDVKTVKDKAIMKQ
jgi:hypothetical protein